MNSRRQNEEWRGPKTIGVDLQRSGSIRRVPLPKCSSADADETDDRKIFHIAPLPYFAWGSASKRYFATHECWEKAGCYNKKMINLFTRVLRLRSVIYVSPFQA